MRMQVMLGLGLLVPALALAAPQEPEIKRAAATAQAVGAVHTLRQIPEACARLQGQFTGNAADPYKFEAVKTSANCQPRAAFVDAVEAKPSEAEGWKFNDLIRVPNASCPSQQAVVQVWRKPVGVSPKLDAQGKARIYLQDAKQKAEAGKLAQIPMFAASMKVEGKACN